MRKMSKALKFFLLVVFAVSYSLYNIQVLERVAKDTVLKFTETFICRQIPMTERLQNRHYICDVDNGRLGNQMFSYASGYALAKEKNVTMAVIKNRMLNYIFELDATKVDECACAKITRLDPKWCCAYDDTLLRFKPETNYQLGNYLQSWKYFHNHTADIRRQFTFNNSTAAKALAFLNGVMDKYKERTSDWSNSADIENITFVGVHVRRGDFKSAKHIHLGYPLASKEYIKKAMNHYTDTFQRVVFIMCSNTMDWVKSNFNSSNMFYSVGNSPEVDMCILSSCNHSIMTVGTFGWWASFLAGGETVHYKHLARKGSILRKQYSSDYKDYFYPGWIGMD